MSERLPATATLISKSSVNELNAAVLIDNPHFSPPYVPNTSGIIFETTQAESFVRVYTEVPGASEIAGEWMMKSSDIQGLTAQQIASKYSLPQVPTMISDVRIPSGVQMRATVANDIQIKQGIGGNGGGGGVQFEVLMPKGGIPTDWFKNARPL